ncbi:MAG TPA: type II toxin-antitoxin system VapC family toxin [Acidimicrobiia bacterium]
MIVIDASVLANVVADDGADGGAAREVVRGADGLSAPELVDVETVSVLRKRWLAGTLSDSRFSAAIDDLTELDVERYPGLPLLRRAFELRTNVSAYDAAYVALAEGLACPLLTADARLFNAPGPRCEIRLLESG